VPFGFFVKPFLVLRQPYLALAADPADEWLIDVIVRKRAIRIDMTELTRIGCYGRRMITLLGWIKARNTISFPQLGRSWISTRKPFF